MKTHVLVVVQREVRLWHAAQLGLDVGQHEIVDHHAHGGFEGQDDVASRLASNADGGRVGEAAVVEARAADPALLTDHVQATETYKALSDAQVRVKELYARWAMLERIDKGMEEN